jgi:hypothetical protein
VDDKEITQAAHAAELEGAGPMSFVLLVTLAVAAVDRGDAGEPLAPSVMPSAQSVAPAEPGADTSQGDAGEAQQQTEEPGEPTEPAPAPADPNVWAGENRRVHLGVGALVHGGFMDSGGYPLWILQSELVGIMSIRVKVHDELRIQLGLAGGYPDSVGGEANVSFLHSLSPRLSVGIGGFAFLSLWSLRVGVEVPLVLRVGSSRRHNFIVALRLHTGVFNNVTLTSWTLGQQRFAFAGDVAAGYAFLF